VCDRRRLVGLRNCGWRWMHSAPAVTAGLGSYRGTWSICAAAAARHTRKHMAYVFAWLCVSGCRRVRGEVFVPTQYAHDLWAEYARHLGCSLTRRPCPKGSTTAQTAPCTHPASRQSKPASWKTLTRPSRSACSLTSPEPGTIMAYTPSATLRPAATAAAARRSSMRELVQEPMKTLSTCRHVCKQATGEVM